jgi:hypothetical protein
VLLEAVGFGDEALPVVPESATVVTVRVTSDLLQLASIILI